MSQQITSELAYVEERSIARLDLRRMSLVYSLETAEIVQKNLLLPCRNIPNIESRDFYKAAEHAGGDWFGHFYNEKYRTLYILIGDVTGHGLANALITGAAAGAAASAFELLRDEELANPKLAIEKFAPSPSIETIQTTRRHLE